MKSLRCLLLAAPMGLDGSAPFPLPKVAARPASCAVSERRLSSSILTKSAQHVKNAQPPSCVIRNSQLVINNYIRNFFLGFLLALSFLRLAGFIVLSQELL